MKVNLCYQKQYQPQPKYFYEVFDSEEDALEWLKAAHVVLRISAYWIRTGDDLGTGGLICSGGYY